MTGLGPGIAWREPPRLTAGLQQDTTLRIVFSNGMMTQEKDAREALESYIGNLRKNAGGMFREG